LCGASIALAVSSVWNLAARFLAEEIGLNLRKAQLLQFWRIFLLLG